MLNNVMKIMNFVVLLIFLLPEPSVSFAASGGVTPSTGYSNQTEFEFYVNFNGDLPSNADVRVSVNGGHAFILNGGPQYWSKTSTFSPADTYDYELQVFENGKFYKTIYDGIFTVLEQPKPDLIIYDLDLNKTTLSIGETLSINAVVKNKGSGESDSTVLRYYLSKNSSISTSDHELGTDSVSSLSPGRKSYESASAPTNSSGTAYVGVCVDRVNNESDTSNNCSSGIRIEIVEPTINSVNASPSTITAGGTITFSASLSTSLPSGYAMTVDYGAGQKSMSGSGTSYSHTSPAINTAGTNRSFAVYLKNSSGSTIDTKSGTFTVNSLPDPEPPTVSISSAPSSVTQGTSYSIRLDCRDPDGNLKNVFVNWGDGSSNSIVELQGAQYYAELIHTYSTPGSYTWRAEVHDHNKLTDSVTKTVNVTSNVPTITQVYTDPDEITAGDTLRVYAKLSAGLPSGYSVKREFYDGDWKFNATMSVASSTLYFTEDPITKAGTRYCRAAIFDGEAQVSDWVEDSFIVHEVENNHAPVISLVNAPDSAQAGTTVSIRVQATDVDNNLGPVQINWGDGSDTGLFSQYSGDYFDATHVYRTAGTYTWTTTAYDNGDPNLSSEILSRQITIEEGQANLPEATHFTPTSAIVGQYQDYTIYGSNLPADLVVNIEGSTNHCSNVSGSGNSVVVNCRADVVGQKHLYMTTEAGGEAIAGSEGFYVAVRSEAASGPLTPPLDGKQVSGAVFFDATIPEGEISTYYYDRVDLLKNGTVVAYCPLTVMASGAGILNQSHLGLYVWYMSNGTPLTQWRQLLNSGENAEMQLKAHATNGSTADGNPFNVTGHSDLSVDIICKDRSGQSVTFPHTGKLVAFFSAQISGSYTYRWLHDNGVDFSTLATGTTTLGSGMRTGLCLITLEVDDNAGHLHYEQQMAYIDEPWESGAGGRRVNHVDVRNRNLYLSANDLSVAAKGISFALRRSYNSAKADGNLTGWHFNFDQRLRIPVEQGGRELYLYRADGRQERYFRNNNGEWQAGRSGMFDILMENSDGTYTLYTKGSTVYRFANPDDGGALISITDRDGNSLTITSTDDTHKTVTDSVGRSYTLKYDSNGHLITATDFSGRSVSYGYDSSGNLTRYQDVNGAVTTYLYDDHNLLTGVIDPRGAAAANRYNALTITYESHKVATVTDADGNTTEFLSGQGDDGTLQTGVVRPTTQDISGERINNNSVYLIDDSGRIIEEVNAETYDDYRNRTRHQYKEAEDIDSIAEKGLVLKVTNPREYSTDFIWSKDGRGNRTGVTNALDETTRSTYATEEDGEISAEHTNLSVVSSTTTALDNTYVFSHTDSGKTSQMTSPTGSVTRMTYTTAGQVERVYDPLNNQTNFTYDADTGQVSTVTDALGISMGYTYDDLGRTETITDRRGGVTYFTYDAAGRVLTRTEAHGTSIAATTTNVYDDNGNLVQVTDPRGNRRTMTYTKGNRLESESFTVEGTTYTKSYEYDALGRLWRTTNANSHAQSSTFDAAGRKVTRTNALDATTTYTYDENGNTLTVTDPLDRVTTYTYDKLDRVKTVTDHLGNEIAYAYDKEGHVTTKTDANGNQTHYSYYDDGKLETVTDANDNQTTATYDDAGNLKTVTGPKPGNMVTYGYDELNRKISMTDAEGHEWKFAYDNNSNLISETMPDGRTISYEYDLRNRVTQVTYADGSRVSYLYDENSNRTEMIDSLGTTQYSYDEANRLTSVTDPFGKSVSYNYDGVGNVTAMVYPGSKTLNYGYDKGERLETVTSWMGNTTTYQYNDIHQLTKILNGNGTVTKYTYDKANRLIELLNRTSDGAVISQHQNTLDGNGNITQSIVDLPLEPSFDTGSISMNFDDANRIANAGTTSFTHDLGGRIISRITDGVTTSYSYNDRDLLTSISGEDSYSFLYNGSGNRLAKTVNGMQTRYVLDLNAGLPNVLAETSSSGTVSAYYTYGNGLLSRIDAITGTEYFYHYDPTGNTLAMTDASQNVVDRYAYTPYGEVTAETSTDNPFRYSGRHGVMDDGNGLNYMRARYYQPESKRFLSLDALYGDVNEPQSLNRYAYVQGNPIGKVDPSGKSWKAVGYFALAGIGIVSIGLTAPAFAASGSIILGVSLIGSTLGTAGSLAGGISQTALELTVSDKDKIEQMEQGIRDAVQTTDMFWSVSYVASGGNEAIASYGEAVGNVYSLSTGFYSLSTLNTNGSNVVTLANGLTSVHDIETAVIKLSKFVGENLSKTNSQQKSGDNLNYYYNRNTNQCVAE